MAAECASYVFFGSDEGASAAAARKKYAELTEGTDEWGNETIDGAAATVDEAPWASSATPSTACR